MANKNFIIKNYNGTTWDELYPKTVGGQVTEDSTHRFATDTEKSAWNAKQAALGFTPEDSANKNATNGYAGLSGGLISINQIPPAALERLIVVADDTARFALTTATAQLGDTVKVISTGKMYFIVDDTQLGLAAGYVEYSAGTAASVPWSGVSSTPTTLSGYGITDAVPSTRTVNGKALSSNITLAASDVGAAKVTVDLTANPPAAPASGDFWYEVI